MSDKRICKYCGMELSEDIPHGLRECHLYAVARIAELEAKNERYIKLIQDWVDVLDPRYPQGDGLASAVRLAMIESIDETPEVQK